MEVGIIGIVVAVVSGLGSFLLTRWLSRRSRHKQMMKMRAAAEASQSRQVRRARERQRKDPS
jgi:type II secretory pathway pseudopilin PulG